MIKRNVINHKNFKTNEMKIMLPKQCHLDMVYLKIIYKSVNPLRVDRLIYISKEKTHKKWKQEIFWITNHDMWIEKESDVK